MKKALLSSLMVLILAGCGSSGVSTIGPDTFEITKQAHNIFGGGAPAAKQSANEAAQKECAKQNKRLLVKRSMTAFERPFYRNTIVFRCLSENDPEYKRPNIKKSGSVQNQQNVIIQNSNNNPAPGYKEPLSSKSMENVEQVQVPVKIDWEELKNTPKGTLRLPNLLKWKDPEVPLILKVGSVTCEGSSIAKSGSWSKGEVARGVFFLKCSNDRVLTGTYVSPKMGEGIGNGIDDNGKSLTFVYGNGAL